MVSKLTQDRWDRGSTFLQSLSPKDAKLVCRYEGQEARAFNLLKNKGVSAFDCSVCGKLKPDLQSRCCSDVCTRRGKSYFLGKKRLDHAKHMSELMTKKVKAGTAWGEEHRASNKRHLAELNSRLDRQAHGKKLKSLDGKREQLRRALFSEDQRYQRLRKTKLWKRSGLAKLSETALGKVPADGVRNLHRLYNSIKSIEAADRNPNMGSSLFYKRTTLKGLRNYWKNKRKTVTVRSSLEYAFVRWLESQEEFTWRYEWYKVDTDYGFCVPDFKLYGTDTWVVETKGFYRETLNSRLVEKTLSVIAFCRDKGYKYAMLSTNQVGRNGVKVDPESWKDLTELTDRQVLKYIRQTIPGAKQCQL